MTFTRELQELLEEELQELKLLLNKSEEKTETLIENDLEKIVESIKGEEELIKNIIVLERDRMELLDSWGLRMDTPITSILQENIEGKEELTRLRDDLAITMSKLEQVNNLNNSILKEHMDWVEFNVNLFTSAKAPVAYDEETDGKVTRESRVFDSKA